MCVCVYHTHTPPSPCVQEYWKTYSISDSYNIQNLHTCLCVCGIHNFMMEVMSRKCVLNYTDLHAHILQLFTGDVYWELWLLPALVVGCC